MDDTFSFEEAKAPETAADGTFSFEEASQPAADESLLSKAGRVAKTIGARAVRNIVAPVEAGAQMISGMGATMLGGIAGIGELAKISDPLAGQPGYTPQPFDSEAASRAVERTAGALTYEPRTAAGKAVGEYAQMPFQALAKAGDVAGEAVRQETGSPALAAAVNTAVQFAIPALLGKAGGMVTRAGEVPRGTAEAAARAPAPGEHPFPIGEAARAEVERIQKRKVAAPPAEGEAAPFPEEAGRLEDLKPADRRAIVREGEERRQNADLRARWPSMTDEQKLAAMEDLHTKAYTDEMTGLGNRRAFNEAPALPTVVSIDADSLKWYNDTFGHEVGDDMLKRIASAIKEETPNGYRGGERGDEFWIRANSPEEAHALMQRVNERLAREEIVATDKQGNQIRKRGLGLSYGVGDDLKVADSEMLSQKAERVKRGLRPERAGEPPGVERLGEAQAGERAPALAPGTVGMGAFMDPRAVKEAAAGLRQDAGRVMAGIFGEPGKFNDLFNPIRNKEQTNVARIDRWATGEGATIRRLIPDKKARENLTMKIVSGDLSGLTADELAVAQRIQQGYRAMGDYAVQAKRLGALRENYSPQMWDTTDKHTREMIEMWREARDRGPIREDAPLIRPPSGGGLFSPFLLERSISDVMEGIKMGLKPATLDSATLFETYARSVGRAVERGKSMKALMNLTSDDGVPMVLPREQAPRSYESIRNDEFEGLRVHPDIAPAVRVMMQADDPGVLARMAQLAAYSSKRGLVSYSMFHPVALTEAWMGSGGNILTMKGAIDAALRKYREGGAGDLLDDGLKGGLKVDAPIEDVMGRDVLGRAAAKAEKILDNVGAGAAIRVPRAIDRALQRVTWDYVQTGLKIDTFLRKYEYELAKNAERINKGEITREQIAEQVAKYANSTFGGLNWERMIDDFNTPAGRKLMSEVMSQSGRRWMQTFLFAPDWLVSTIGSWTGAVTGGEAAAIRQQLARRYLATSALYTMAIGNGLNYYFTGHSMFSNRSNKKDATWGDNLRAKTEVQLGDGRHMNINKHFMEVPHAISDPGQFLMNKLNPLTVGEPLEQLFNKDWLSTGWSPPITKKTDPTMTAAGKRLAHVAGKVMPITGRSVMQQGPAGLGGFFGVPVYGLTEEQKYREREEKARQK